MSVDRRILSLAHALKAAIDNGELDRAREIHDDLIALLPAEPEPNVDVLSGYLMSVLYWLAIADIANSSKLMDRIESMMSRAPGAPGPAIAAVAEMHARVLKSEFKFDEARAQYERALAALSSEGPRNQLRAVVLGNLGDLHEDEGLWSTALSFYHRALAEVDQDDPIGKETYLRVLSNLARSLSKLGRSAEAIPVLTKALEGRERTKPNPLEKSRLLTLLSKAEEDVGDLASAIEHLGDAETTLGSLGSDEDRAALRLDRAALNVAMGLSHEALSDYQEALKIYEEAGLTASPGYGAALDATGGLYLARHDLPRAETFMRRAAAVWEKYGPSHFDVAVNLQHLAELEIARGDLAKAEKTITEALDVLVASVGHSHPVIASCFRTLGRIAFARGDYGRSRDCLYDAYHIVEAAFGEQHPDLAEIHDDLAQTHIAEGNPEKAFEELLASQRIWDEVIDTVLSVVPDRQRLEYVTRFRASVATFERVVGALPNNGQAASEGYGLVLRRKGIAADASAAALKRLRGSPESARKWFEIRAEIGRLILEGLPSRDPEAATRLADLTRERDRLESELARDNAVIRSAQSLREIRFVDVIEALPQRAALVEFVRVPGAGSSELGRDSTQGDRYVAYVVRPDLREPQRLDLGSAKEIDGLVERFRLAITGAPDYDRGRDNRGVVQRFLDWLRGPAAREEREVGQLLRERLLAGVDVSDLEILYVAADSQLAKLPFAALRDGDGFLLDSLEVRYVGTGRDLVAARRSHARGSEATGALVIGDPDYDLALQATSPPGETGTVQPYGLKGALHRFGRLEETGPEAEAIAALYGVAPTLRQHALEGTVKQAGDVRIVHLATHGFFLGVESVVAIDPMLRSGIVLAGYNAWLRNLPRPVAAEDGLLTADDFLEVPLSKVELVVLSACETGLGYTSNGEGVFGLRRALSIVGARAAVLSLWKVPDAPTKALMIALHENYNAGMSASKALLMAQRDMRSSNSTRAWAAFTFSGYA